MTADHRTDLDALLRAVRDLLLALQGVRDLPPPVWAALDEVRKAVAPDLGPPPDLVEQYADPRLMTKAPRRV